ncbi:hypothetical protein [Pelagibius sp.]|uniref:hypothetical protein n=1 Tax=Pelagibius sp. TaxID=1931238 RepID=UPI0026186DB8|nr:hypothetical protein [Pelagibius sp.]
MERSDRSETIGAPGETSLRAMKVLFAGLTAALVLSACASSGPQAVGGADQTAPQRTIAPAAEPWAPAPNAGFALVAATAKEVVAARGSAGSATAWQFRFAVRSEPQTKQHDGDLTITLSEADYAVIEGGGHREVIDYALARVFHIDSAAGTFQSTSLSTAPYFRAAEWASRSRIAKIVESTGGSNKALAITSEFWRTHNIGLQPPRRDATPPTVRRNRGALVLVHESEEAARLEPAEMALPAWAAARFWDVMRRAYALHPDFIARAEAEQVFPARLVVVQRLLAAPQSTDLRLMTQSRVDQSYPVTADLRLVEPSTEHNPRAAGLVATAWNAANGRFEGEQPDTAYWTERLEQAERDGRKLEPLLVVLAMGLYTGTQSPGCDGAADLSANTLCASVRAASDKTRYGADVSRFMALVGAKDRATQQRAINELPSYRADAGAMAPLIDLFIANHISDLTRVITRGGPGYPNRDEAVDLYLSALQAFPFTKQIYGDIADYYFRSFDMRMGFYFADVGRSLPVPTAAPAGSNLDTVSGIEGKLRADFPEYF